MLKFRVGSEEFTDIDRACEYAEDSECEIEQWVPVIGWTIWHNDPRFGFCTYCGICRLLHSECRCDRPGWRTVVHPTSDRFASSEERASLERAKEIGS